MVKYRPHKSTLDESMKYLKLFKTQEEMIQWITNDWKLSFVNHVESEEFTVTIDGKDYGKDERIGWEHWHYVLLNNAIVGMCDLG